MCPANTVSPCTKFIPKLSPCVVNTKSSTTDKIDTRARGRLAAIKIENDALNDNWRYGVFRLDIQPDGRGGSGPQT